MDLVAITQGMTAAGIVPGSVSHRIASTWKYGNSYTNSREIAQALGIDPDVPAEHIAKLLAIGVAVMGAATCTGNGLGIARLPGDYAFVADASEIIARLQAIEPQDLTPHPAA